MDVVMSYFSESSMACVPLLTGNGVEVETHEHAPTLEEWLERVSKATGPATSLSDVIQGAHPWHGDLRILPHPNQDAYVLASWPDDMANALDCNYRQAIRDGKSPPNAPPSNEPYYGTAFRIRAAGEHSPVFLLLWAREDAGWRVASFNVLTH